MQNKIKHLEFIQNIIARMNRNSFQIKGMSVTISSAILALSISQSNSFFFYIILFSVLIFWVLDAYYLSIEKRYRKMYSEVAKKDESKIDFNLTLGKEKVFGKNSWLKTIINGSIWPFYFIQFILATLLFINSPS